MTLYLDKNDFGFFASPDLKNWRHLHNITVPDCAECPDFFEMPVKGRKGETRWVWTAANGRYLIGTFDGAKFTPESGPHIVEYGANCYAVQTYSDIPASDGRRIQMAWMNGGRYPQMPFNQQMAFPCELTLRAFPEGLRLCKQPVKEIETLREQGYAWSGLTLKPGENPLSGLQGELWDIRVEFEVGDAAAFGLRARGEEVGYRVGERTLSALGRTAPLEPVGRRVKIRALVDRTSLEVYGNDGRVALTSCFLPRAKEKGLELFAEGGSARVVSLQVYSLRTAWTRR
jgi:sucrose-6-phosphate hydrolase SacC (GH32 family)